MAEEWNRVPGVHPQHPAPLSYTVKPGDSLCGIARRFGITLAALAQANPQLTEAGLLNPGRILCIPDLPPPAGCPHGSFYTVQAGENLSEIAARFGLSLQTLLAANPQIAAADVIYEGQVICIPAVPPVILPPVPGPSRGMKVVCPLGITFCPLRRSCPLHCRSPRGRRKRRRRKGRESGNCF